MKNLYLLVSLSFFGGNILAQSFSDPNFSVSTIVSGWTEPVGAVFSKDAEKLFVWEKAGFLYVCNKSGANYVKQTTPVIDLTAETLNWRDHGLMGFALDPDFATNGYIYLLYIVDRRFLMNNNSIAADAGGSATIARVTKYKTILSGGNLVVDHSTRTILIGESPSTGIAVVHESHVIGSLAFAADGTLLVSTGDGASYYLMDVGSDSDTYWSQAITDGILRPSENVGAFRSQILNCHNGKLLRIDPATGNGISSNPFYSATEPRAAKSRVWAMGFRNPFRILVRPGTGSTNSAAGDIGEVYAGDVGWGTWEEFTIITGPGMNAGWPVYEGHEINSQYNTRAATLQNMDEPNPLAGQTGCSRPYFTFRELIKDPTADENKTINNPCNAAVAIGTGNRYVHRRPAIDYKHEQESARVGIFSGNNAAVAEIGTAQSGVVGTPFAGNCALSGVWYTGNNFPPDYKNSFLLVDHTARWIKRFTIDYTDVITRVDNLVMVFANIVSAAENPIDGTLAVVDITTHTVKKIQYGGNQPPVAVPKANITYGASPLAVNFTGNTSYDLSPGGSIASYSWDFGGGSPATSTAANPTGIVFTDATGNPKKFVVKLTVTDNGGATDVDSVNVSVNNTPPVVNITSPVKNSTYPLGGDAVYNCTATVTDNQHSGAQLKYEWQTILRHNNHEHPEAIDNNVNTTTRISRVGCNGDNYYWLIRLKVTDAAGLSTTDSSKFFPDCGSDNIPPVVTSISPANGATGVSISTAVSADFSEAIDASTVTSSTFQLKDAANNIINALVNTSSNQITLTPASALTGSTVYTATIKGGAPGVKDLAGNALAGDYNWSFTTVAVDIIPPTVTTVAPLNGATGVSTGTTVTANFSEAINSSTVTSSTVQLRDAGNNLIGVTITTSGSQVSLTPSATLTGSTVYTATITGGPSGIKDLAGNALVNNYNWSFTTAAVDNTPPTIISVSPINGATGVSTGTTVIANFSEAINASTVTSSAVQLRNAGNNLVSATLNTSGSQVTLTPSAALTGSAVYTATIVGGASGVKDLAGNALANNYSWSFTTAAVTPQSPVTIQSFTTKTGVAATVHPLTGVPAGALLVLATTADAVPSNAIVSSSPALTWTKRVDAGATNSDNAEIWTAVFSAGGTITVTSNWGTDNSQSSVCYVVLNAEPVLAGVFGTATLQTAPSVTITTTRENSIIFGCTADWKAISGTTRTLRDGATERLYFKDGNFTTYHYTKAAAAIGAYTEGVSLPTGQQACTSLLEIRGNAVAANIPPTVTTQPTSQTRCAGTNASFTSAASGTPAPTVQWQESTNGTSWTNITGATGATLSIVTTTADNNKQYRAAWTNSVSTVNSNAATLTVNTIPATPSVNVTNNCGNSVLAASGFTGSLLWSNGATTASITVTMAGTYTVTQTVNGCTSGTGTGIAAPLSSPATPAVAVVNNCGSSLLTASGFTGTLLWSNGATTNPITVTLAGTYTVTQTVNGCTSAAGSNTAAPLNSSVDPPIVAVDNNCGNSILTASGYTGTLLWSNGATTASITANTPGTYTVTQTVSGCTSPASSGAAAPDAIPPAPGVSVSNNCGSSILTASGFTGSLTWNTGEIMTSISVTNPGTYTVTQTVNGCTSAAGSNTAAPKTVPAAPDVAVVNNCGSSVLTASGFTGSLLWSNGATTNPITVTTGVTYTVTQTVNGCISETGSGTAAPLNSSVAAPSVSVVNNCNNSVLTASDYTGSLSWSNGATTPSISVTTATTYTVTQTVSGCTSPAGSGAATPINTTIAAPAVAVTNNCGGSVLTASGFTGSLLWSTGETTAIINVTTAGAYTVTQTVDGCTSNAGSGIAAPNTIPTTPSVSVTNNCGNSILTATGVSGTLWWSNGATTNPVTVTIAGVYTVTQTVNGCISEAGSGTAAPLNSTVVVPSVSVVNNCTNSVLTASDYTGSLLWSNGATTPSITVTTAGTYTVTQTVSGCTSPAGSGTAAPVNTTIVAPAVSVANNCGNSVLTASGFTGSLLWSNGATTNPITVATANTYTVTQTINGCTGPLGSGAAVPKAVPVLSSNLTAAATSGTTFTYTATSAITGTTFAWSRAAVTGISNATASGTGNINETLVNTTASPVNVTYVYTLTANGCINTQNLVVTVNPAATTNCVINSSITSSFNSTSIQAGRYIWFSNVFDRGSFSGITGTVTFTVTNSVITFTANSQQYTLNVPNSRIRFDAAVTSATTQFVNNVWETAVPRAYSGYVFMGGFAYQVPASLPGNITDVAWTATISIDRAGVSLTRRWTAAVYTSFTAHSGLNIKPKNGSTQNPYPNNDNAGTPENFKPFVVSGAKGSGGTNYTGSYSTTSTATCVVTAAQRSAVQPPTTRQSFGKQIPALSIENLAKEKLEVNVMPNPSNTFFNLAIRGNNQNPVIVRVMNIFGQVVERHDKIAANTVLQLGHKWVAGPYFVEVIQADQRKFVKIIKVN